MDEQSHKEMDSDVLMLTQKRSFQDDEAECRISQGKTGAGQAWRALTLADQNKM